MHEIWRPRRLRQRLNGSKAKGDLRARAAWIRGGEASFDAEERGALGNPGGSTGNGLLPFEEGEFVRRLVQPYGGGVARRRTLRRPELRYQDPHVVPFRGQGRGQFPDGETDGAHVRMGDQLCRHEQDYHAETNTLGGRDKRRRDPNVPQGGGHGRQRSVWYL